MAAIRRGNTVPEVRLRTALHALGYRYRLHGRSLPGRPDLVFPSRKKVIFVHGCFWHRHDCKAGWSMPNTRAAFWSAKFDGNVRRDKKIVVQIRNRGWSSLVVWECQLTPLRLVRALERVVSFLES